jgi:hypothetical protein
MDERRGLRRWMVGGAVAVAGLFAPAASQAQAADESSGARAMPVRPAVDPHAALLAPPAAPPRATSASAAALSGES